MLNQNSIKSHCPQGHLYDEANTRITKKNQRICRTCERARNRRLEGFCGWSGCNELTELDNKTNRPFYYCKEHVEERKKQHKTYYSKNKEMHKERYGEGSRFRTHVKWQELRTKLFEMYGSICVCCGEDCQIFLTLDHINGDGSKDRKGCGGTTSVYKKAIAEYRPDLYQILCYNCNCGKRLNKECPHKSMSLMKIKEENEHE
jgi:hypothetical protein